MAAVKFLEFTNPFEENAKEIKIPIRISNYALTMLKEETGSSLMDLDKEGFSKEYSCLFYHSLVQGFYFTQKKFEYERDFVERVIYDLVFMDFLSILPEFFEEIQGKPKKDNKTKTKPGKK